VRVAGAVSADAVVSAVAVEAGGSRVFVGTVAGWVLVYELKGSNPEARTLSQTQKRSFGRKPVEVRHTRLALVQPAAVADSRSPTSRALPPDQALCLFPAHRRLAVLVDGCVSLVDSTALAAAGPAGGPLAALRGATHLASVRPLPCPLASAL